jgi:hypothetical protein
MEGYKREKGGKIGGYRESRGYYGRAQEKKGKHTWALEHTRVK